MTFNLSENVPSLSVKTLQEIEIPKNTMIFDYAFMGCMELNKISKGHNVLYCKHSFAITPHISQDGDRGLLKQILDKAPSKRMPKNRFQNRKNIGENKSPNITI